MEGERNEIKRETDAANNVKDRQMKRKDWLKRKPKT